MTVARLLSEADSVELSLWQRFLKAQGEYTAEQRKKAQEDAAIMGPDA